MRNTMVLKNGKPFKAGIVSNTMCKVLISKNCDSDLNRGYLPSTCTGKCFAIIREDKLQQFRNKGYFISKLNGPDLYVVADKNINNNEFNSIIIFIENNCIPVMQCECVGVHKGIITIINNMGQIKHYKQEGLRDENRLKGLIVAGKVNAQAAMLDEIPKYIELVSELNGCVPLNRTFKSN